MEGARLSSPTPVPVADYAAVVDGSALRRDSLGLSVEQSTTIWRALERATAVVVADAKVDRHRQEKLMAQLASVTSMVRRIARRNSDGVATSSVAVDREVLGALRKAFLRELHSETAIDGRQVVRVLSAFETVSSRCATLRKPAQAGVAGLEALVEVAHDMRSPLTSILFLVDAIRTGKSGPVTQIQERQLGLIYGAALGLSTLASDLIDLVRGGGSLVEGEPAPFSLAEVLGGVTDLVTPIAEEKRLRLECSPPLNDGRVGYAAALSRVLLNLTTNAVKFTERGSVKIHCAEVTNMRVRFSVIDSGLGLPQEVRRSLFSPFTHSRGRMRFSNSGLGLSICRSLLGAMHSELLVETQTGVGSRFSFELDLPPA